MTSRCVALALMLGLPASGWAENLVLGLDTQTGWDDNLFFSTVDEEDAFPYRFSPWVELRRERGDLTYDLNLRVIYEDFFNQSNADTFDEVLRLNARYRVSEATEFTFQERFSRVQSLSRRLETQDPTSEVVPDIENARQRSLRNSASVAVRHALSRRWTLNASFTDTLFDFQDDDFVDSNSMGLNTSLVYALTPRDQVGFGLGATRQDFDSTNQRPASETNFYRAFGSWGHLFSPTFSMNLQVGPTWIDTSSDGGGGSDSRFTYFGAANLTKRWETVFTTLGYTRTDSSSSGNSGSTVLDTVNGNVVWRPSPRWNLALLGSWTRRESATTQFAIQRVFLPPPAPPGSFADVLRAIDTDDTVDQIYFEARGERRITRYLSVFTNITWLQQKRDISSFTPSSTTQERFQVLVGIRWRTQPFFF